MKQILFITILFFSLKTIYAQKIEQDFPISISIMSESMSLPIVSNPFKYRYNPSLLIGTEFLLKEKNKYDFYLSGNLGYYYHKDWESTLYTEIKFGYRYKINRFSISPNLGLGYAHIFATKPVYSFENDKFKEVKNNGKSAFQSSLSIIPSFKLFQKKNSAEIHLIYSFTVQYPYSETSGFHQFVGIGYKFYPFKNK